MPRNCATRKSNSSNSMINMINEPILEPQATEMAISEILVPQYPMVSWLVVLTILKDISQREGLSHILWKIKNV